MSSCSSAKRATNAASPNRPRCRASFSTWCSVCCECFGLPVKRRSKPSSALATVQPWFSSPTRFSRGTRTLSKNTSQNSLSAAMFRIGRTVMPGVFRSTSRKLMPDCFSTVLSVRTSMNMWVPSAPQVVQVFCPFTMN